MKNSFVVRLALAVSVGLGLALALTAPDPAAAAPMPAGISGGAEAGSLVTEVKKWKGPRGRSWKVPKKWRPGRYYGPRGVYVRTWRRRPYYGRVIGGVALGTILGVAIAGAVPRAPSSDLCWYWTNPARTHGYWDYCY